MLNVEYVTHSFGDNLILDNVSFSLEKGEIIGLVAPNGTGKTTLLNIIMNFITPNSGGVTFEDDGNHLDYSTSKSEVEMHKNITFLPELEHLYLDLTGRDHLDYYARLWSEKKDKVDTVINRLNIQSYVDTKVNTYSLGMKQRLAFAMILCADSPIMLMDEVMNGLDPENVDLLTGILMELKEKGKTIMIASHLLDNLDIYADRLMFIKDSKIVLKEYKTPKDWSGNYLKVNLTEIQLEQLRNNYEFPEGSTMMNKTLFVIPLSEATRSELNDIMAFFFEHDIFEVSISSIGASEWYDYYYRD